MAQLTIHRGIYILYTGDFRLHSVRGGKTLKMLNYYAKNIDYIIY